MNKTTQEEIRRRENNRDSGDSDKISNRRRDTGLQSKDKVKINEK